MSAVEPTVIHLPMDWWGCTDRPGIEGRHEELTDPGEVGDLTCPTCRDVMLNAHLVTLHAGRTQVTIPVSRQKDGPGFQVDVDSQPVVGLGSGPDGYLWLGHWPNEDEWADLAPTTYRDPDQEER